MLSRDVAGNLEGDVPCALDVLCVGGILLVHASTDETASKLTLDFLGHIRAELLCDTDKVASKDVAWLGEAECNVLPVGGVCIEDSSRQLVHQAKGSGDTHSAQLR